VSHPRWRARRWTRPNPSDSSDAKADATTDAPSAKCSVRGPQLRFLVKSLLTVCEPVGYWLPDAIGGGEALQPRLHNFTGGYVRKVVHEWVMQVLANRGVANELFEESNHYGVSTVARGCTTVTCGAAVLSLATE
jgi:hypothetical protein